MSDVLGCTGSINVGSFGVAPKVKPTVVALPLFTAMWIYGVVTGTKPSPRNPSTGPEAVVTKAAKSANPSPVKSSTTRTSSSGSLGLQFMPWQARSEASVHKCRVDDVVYAHASFERPAVDEKLLASAVFEITAGDGVDATIRL